MADKALEVQREVRAHTQMAVDFCRDLDNWESQISKVDEQLSKTKALKSQFPPPRSQRQQPEQQPPAAVPGDKATKATGGVRGKTKKKISGYDFRSWDKYDADAEAAAVEAAEEGETEPQVPDQAEVDAAPMVDLELQEHMANIEKDKGNDQYKQGKYRAACDCYTRGIEINPYSHILVANRAMARLKLKQWEAAESDCSRALDLSPRFVKALSRRATARAELGKLGDAIADWQKVLKHEPKNKQAQTELTALRKRKKVADEEHKRTFNPMKAAAAQGSAMSGGAASGRQRKPLRRIPIEEIGEAVDLPTSQPATAADLPDKSKRIIEEVEASAVEPSTASAELAPPAVRSTVSPDVPSPAKMAQMSSTAVPMAEASTSPVQTLSTAAKPASETLAQPVCPEKGPTPAQAKGVSRPVGSQAASVHSRSGPSPAKGTAGPGTTSSGSVGPAVPKTGLKFGHLWTSETRDLEARVALLQATAASQTSFAKLFRQDLPPELFCSILATLCEGFLPAGLPTTPVLAGLAEVPRVATTVMFLDDAERRWLDTLLGPEGGLPDDVAAKLRKRFGA